MKQRGEKVGSMSSHTTRSSGGGTALGRIVNDPKYAAPLAAVGLNVLLGIASCIAYHQMTGQTFAPDPKCMAVYLYTSIGTIGVGLVGVTYYDAIPGRSPLRKTLFLAAAAWAIFVAATFLPVSSSLSRRGVPRTTAYYGVAALAVMGLLMYVRNRLTGRSA